MLMIAESITPQLKDFTTAKDIWDYLERSYGRPRVSAVYTDFKKLLQMSIPDNKDPTVALDEYVAHCNRLAANNVTFDEHIKAMILMAQLPQSMEAAVLLAINGKEVKQLSIADVRTSIMLHVAYCNISTIGSSHVTRPKKSPRRWAPIRNRGSSRCGSHNCNEPTVEMLQYMA